MKEILLMRHAKSSWENPGLKDFDRPLAKRGLKDAPRMGEFLRKTGNIPGLIVSSPAKRAKETTQLSMKAAQVDESFIHWNDDFYFGSAGDYLAALQTISEEVERVLLVGHNPLMELTAGLLTNGEAGTVARMPTAALICLESHITRWESISPGSCQIKWMMIPKVLDK
jgi:phosphohistidine phosphatase